MTGWTKDEDYVQWGREPRKEAPWPVEFITCDAGTRMQVSGSLTHLCPVKNEFDVGYVTVSWTTSGKTVELHSLAKWLADFAPVPITHEELVDHITATLNEAAVGGITQIETAFAGRTAGLHVTATSTTEW